MRRAEINHLSIYKYIAQVKHGTPSLADLTTVRLRIDYSGGLMAIGMWSWCKRQWAGADVEIAAKEVARAGRRAEPDLRRGAPIRLDTVAERLTYLFGRHHRGEIGLDEYAQRVRNEQVDCNEAILHHHQCRSGMNAAEFEAVLEELEEEAEECNWRLRWIDDQKHKAGISRDGFAERGKWARFDYMDHHELVSTRNITMWEKRGAYIVGYDRSRKAGRTFRQDRISDWVCG